MRTYIFTLVSGSTYQSASDTCCTVTERGRALRKQVHNVQSNPGPATSDASLVWFMTVAQYANCSPIPRSRPRRPRRLRTPAAQVAVPSHRSRPDVLPQGYLSWYHCPTSRFPAVASLEAVARNIRSGQCARDPMNTYSGYDTRCRNVNGHGHSADRRSMRSKVCAMHALLRTESQRWSL